MTAFKIPTRPIAPKGEQRRPRKEVVDHRRFLNLLPCLACRRRHHSECAHIRYASIYHGKDYTGGGRKPDDRWSVPLCATCHRTGPDAQHNTNEREWWEAQKIDPLVIAALLWSHTGDEEAAERVVLHARTICYGFGR